MMNIAFRLLILLCGLASVTGSEFRAGAAAVNITPPIGTPLAGYYYERGAEGTHDELHAKALVIEQDGSKAAMVVCDLLTIPRGVIQEAREQITKSTGLKGENVMISATHTHTGPILGDGLARAASLGGDSDLVSAYTRKLPSLIAESVRLAEAKLAPSRTFAAIGREDGISHNRRYFMKTGTVSWNPGKLNTNIVRAAGPIDPDVGVIYFESAERTPSPQPSPPRGRGSGEGAAIYLNFAMHPDTAGGKEFSADYPYWLARGLSEYKGTNLLTIFANGTCGNINHVDVNWADPQKGQTESARLGTILAGAVMRAFPRLQPIQTSAPRVRSEIVKIPLPQVTPEDIENARSIAKRAQGAQSKEPAFLERVNAFKVLDVAAREGKPHELEVQVIALGDELAWVSLPGEIFVELGLAIKKASPFRYTMIAELANGAIGYIPNREAYPQGNYEVVSSRCAEGSGELLVEAALRLLRQAHRGQ